jgi:hypothetical protein
MNLNDGIAKSISVYENVPIILMRDLSTELYLLKTAFCSDNRIMSVCFLRKANHKIRDST